MLLEDGEGATIEDLLRVDGKAELIGGRIVHMMAVGHSPNRVAGRIYASLLAFADRTRLGEPYSDGMGFSVPELRSGRQSFSPDVSFYLGPPPEKKMRFVEGPPTFAVEVRSENDYGPAAELAIAAKRADYFEAETLVVWDVDTVGRFIVYHKRIAPWTRELFQPGQIASAEPAVPGWLVKVDDIFRD